MNQIRKDFNTEYLLYISRTALSPKEMAAAVAVDTMSNSLTMTDSQKSKIAEYSKSIYNTIIHFNDILNIIERIVEHHNHHYTEEIPSPKFLTSTQFINVLRMFLEIRNFGEHIMSTTSEDAIYFKQIAEHKVDMNTILTVLNSIRIDCNGLCREISSLLYCNLTPELETFYALSTDEINCIKKSLMNDFEKYLDGVKSYGNYALGLAYVIADMKLVKLDIGSEPKRSIHSDSVVSWFASQTIRTFIQSINQSTNQSTN